MYFGNNTAKLNIIHNTFEKPKDDVPGIQQDDVCVFRLPNEATRIDGDDPEYNLRLFRRFEDFPHSISVDFNNLEEVGKEALYSTFDDCYGKKLICTKLRRVYGEDGCLGVFMYSNFEEINFNFASIEELSGDSAFAWAFEDCINLPPVIHFKKLVNVRNRFVLWDTFELYENKNKQTLKEIYFESLRSDSFGEYTNQFRGMIANNSNVIVHFPSNLESVIGNWADILEGFDGKNTTVLFDLPETE